MRNERARSVRIIATLNQAWVGLTLAVMFPMLAGCGTTAATKSATTQAEPTVAAALPTVSNVPMRDLLVRDARELRESSYTPQSHVVGRVPGGQLMIIFHTVCTGSADGHCQAAQVFVGSRRTPSFTGHYAGITRIRDTGVGFSVTSVRYAPSDPLCCPSLPPETMRYAWNGHKFLQQPAAAP